MRSRLLPVALLATGAIAASAVPALAANLTVAPRKASFGCAQNEQFTSINAAVVAAHPGDQVTVCPGTYQEQVLVNKANLTLQSQQPQQATIKAPTTMTGAGAIVEITATGDKLTNFTITNSGQSTSPNSIQYGVFVHDGGSADLEHNDISDISDAPISGDQNGVAVEAGDGSASPATSGTLTLKANTIENYQKNGVTVDSSGSSGDIENNVITGVGPTSTIAQNGIQISDGATGVIKSNTVSNNVYSPGSVASTGILLYAAGQTDSENNVLSTNDVGFYAYVPPPPPGAAGTNPTTVANANKIIASTYDGLILDGTNGAKVQNDQAVGTWGRQAYGPDNGDGFDVYATSGALLQGDIAGGNSEDGIHDETGATGNTFNGDQASANLSFDCQDDNGGPPANVWQNDKGDINMPQAICQGNPAVATAAPTGAASALSSPTGASARPQLSPSS